MKLKEAVNRLRFTISKQHKPNESDIEAFNTLCDYLQKVQEETVQENLLFAKLYAYLLGKLTSHYNDIDQANQHLNKILSHKMTYLYSILELELRAMEIRKNFGDEFLKNRSPKDLKETIGKNPLFEKEFSESWDYWDEDNVISNLNAAINLSIQNYKNHV